MEDCVINIEPSTELKSQLNAILSELSNLKEAVHGTNLSFASEVKKLKTEKDLKWRFQGNKVQFDFNSDLADSVKQCIWAINNGKLDHCKEELEELSSKLRKRNKLVRIADSSTDGWDTVRQYGTKAKFTRPKGEHSSLNVHLRRVGVVAPTMLLLLIASALQLFYLPFYHNSSLDLNLQERDVVFFVPNS